MSENEKQTPPNAMLEAMFTPESSTSGSSQPTGKEKFLARVKSVGIWAAVVIGFGLLVFLLTYFLMVRPLKLANGTLEENAAAMEIQLAEYRTEIADQAEQIAALEAQTDELQTENALYADYMVYLKLLNNLTQMQRAQLLDDAAEMKVSLANAHENLIRLEPRLATADDSLMALLQERLSALETSKAGMQEMVQEIKTLYVYLFELQETLFGTLY